MKVSKSALLPYTASQMYQVVADVECYPNFLPGCAHAQIMEQRVLSDDVRQVIAKVGVSYAKLDVQFTTENTNREGESIELNLVDGPFSSLHGLWSFNALSDNACKVTLDMQFKFNNPLMNKVMGVVFSKVVETQFDAFQARAMQLYT